MERIQRMFASAGVALPHTPPDSPALDTSEHEMLNSAFKCKKVVQDEDELPPEKLAIANVGRQDAKKHQVEYVSNIMSSNIVRILGTMLDTVVF